jgi:hypothetical protein
MSSYCVYFVDGGRAFRDDGVVSDDLFHQGFDGLQGNPSALLRRIAQVKNRFSTFQNF